MIKNIRIIEKRTTILLKWKRPKYDPVMYRVTVICHFVASPNSSEYLKIVNTRGGSCTSIQVIDVFPGSNCLVTFRAIYSSAALDEGYTITHQTKIAS